MLRLTSRSGLVLSGQKIIGDGLFPILALQRPHRVFIDLRRLLAAATFENVSCPLQQAFFSLVDHRRMTPYSAANSEPCVRPSRLPAPRGFEPSVMVPAFLHILISSFLETSRRQIIASVSVRFSGSSSQPLGFDCSQDSAPDQKTYSSSGSQVPHGGC